MADVSRSLVGDKWGGSKPEHGMYGIVVTKTGLWWVEMGCRRRVKCWVIRKLLPHKRMRSAVITTIVELAGLLTATKRLKKMAGSSASYHLVVCCETRETFTARFKVRSAPAEWNVPAFRPEGPAV